MKIFRISFINQGKVYQLHAESVQQADLYGFVQLSGLIFGETSSVVIDPAEEKLKNEFSGVSSCLIPMHSVIRIDEVSKRGQNKIIELDANNNVMPFPSGLYSPDNTKS
ncbi:MAG: DUF1820 family protein [Chromatiales bacterium]